MGTSNTSLLRRVVFPASLPSPMSGLRIAVPYALMTAFTAEMIAGGGGLGGALVLAQRYFFGLAVGRSMPLMLEV
jgi:ABC-type nitrate/sulfonate/bicarbonate transport system permease component